VALERQLNLQTLLRQREDPFQVAHDGLRRLLYGDGPYGHDPLGLEQDLRSLNPDHLQRLVPGLGQRGAWLVLCGQLPDDPGGLLEAAMAPGPWMVGPSAPSLSHDPGVVAVPGPEQPEDRGQVQFLRQGPMQTDTR
jgi:hypothetical protein